MPSDDRVSRALKAIAGPASAFRSTLATTIGQLESLLTAGTAAGQQRDDRVAGELGVFAAGRIDAAALAALVRSPDALDAGAVQRMQQSLHVLTGLAGHTDDELFVLRVAPGEDLRDALRLAYGARGRAFAAAHVARLSRARQPLARFTAGAGSYHFSRWNARERAAAPPLVVELEGEQVSGCGVAEFVDGGVQIVLVADGPCPPAPLVRLITPGTLVVQTDDPADLDAFAGWDGAAIALLGDATLARFTHDPRVGVSLRTRLRIDRLPAASPGLAAVGREELAQLAALDQLLRAAPTAASDEAPTGATVTVAEPADRLAAWLLRHAQGDAEA